MPALATPRIASAPATTLREAVLHATRDALAAADRAHVVVFDSTHWLHSIEEAADVLTAAEHARALRFRQQQHRDTYVLAHAAWRHALAAVLRVTPAEVPLASEANGRPCLPGTGLATSLSHSGSHVAIAIAHADCIGVDIEQSPTRADLGPLTELLCTTEEANALQRCDTPSREHALLALWTRKEALLKAYGIGLRQPPSGIRVDADVPIAPPPSAPGAPVCRVHALPLPASLVGAVAAPDAIAQVQLRWLRARRA